MTNQPVSQTILLTVDALRPDHMSQYGYERNTMPALDRLDSCATRYDAAFANGTNTGVSLPSILSSRYRGVEPCQEGPTVASALQSDGFRTAGFHSNTLFASSVGEPTGFSDFEDFDVCEKRSENSNTTLTNQLYDRCAERVKPLTEQLGVRSKAKRLRDAVLPVGTTHSMSYYICGEDLTDTVVGWLREHSNESFFLWLHYLDPHRPYGIDLDDPVYGEPADRGEIQNLMANAGVDPASLSESDRRRMIDLYDSDLRYTSKAIGRLFDELESLEIWDQTAMVFTADHGEEFGEHGMYFHRNLPYDEIIRVPLYVKAPEYDREVVTEQRELLDVAPTICELMGVDIPPVFRGNPLSQQSNRRVVATGSFSKPEPVVAGRWDGYKYIFSAEDELLYEVDNDSGEQTDIADRHPEIVSNYSEEIPQHLFVDAEMSHSEGTNDAVEERLRGLGYLD